MDSRNVSGGGENSIAGGVDNAAAKWQIAQCDAGSPEAGAPESGALDLDGALSAISGQHDAACGWHAAQASPGSATSPRRCPGTMTLNHTA